MSFSSTVVEIVTTIFSSDGPRIAGASREQRSAPSNLLLFRSPSDEENNEFVSDVLALRASRSGIAPKTDAELA
jgi:hypothetical protein